MIHIADIINQAIADLPESYLYTPNLKLTFMVGTGVFAFDSVGNEAEVKQPVVVLANVREKSERDRATQKAGTDFTQIYLVGRLSSPKLMPTGIDMEETAEAEYSYAANPLQPNATTKIAGIFRFTANLQDRYPAITAKLGAHITGFLTLRGGA